MDFPLHFQKVSSATGHFFLFFFDKVVKLIVGGSVINGAYPSSLICISPSSVMLLLLATTPSLLSKVHIYRKVVSLEHPALERGSLA